MKKLLTLFITLQLLSCGGINVSDIPLENVNEHRNIINGDEIDKESLVKAYVEIYEENSEALKSPYIYYYLSLLYDSGFEPQFNIDPLKSGLELFPNDPFLNNLKTNKIDADADVNGLNSSINGYQTIIKNHPRFFLAYYNLYNNYKNYFNQFEPVEEDKKIIAEEKNVKNLLSELRGYETADNNTSNYYNFNEIFSDDRFIQSFENMKSDYNEMLDKINSADERFLDLNEAYSIMRRRAINIDQEIYDYFETTSDGYTMYMFLTYNNWGDGCITGFSTFSQEPISADCGGLDRKVREWNAIPGSPKAPTIY